MMDIKVISRNVGFALLVSALFMFLAVGVSILDGMDSAFTPLAISCIITFIVGSFPFIFVKQSSAISIKDGYLIIVLSWLLSFIFGMLPYVLWGGEFNIVNAWFESVSGFTTTGATILTDIEALPRSLLFWRASTHFIGGLGVVVFLLMILPHASPFRLKLTHIEMSSLSKEGYHIRSTSIVYVITSVYIGIFLLSGVSLFLAGMPWFDALTHAFSIAATGGFSIKNASIAGYDSTLINFIVVFFAFLSSLHYGLIFTALVSRSLKPLLNNSIVKYYLSSIAVMTIIMSLALRLNGVYEHWGRSLLDSFYQVIMYITTTGFGMVDNGKWPFLASIVLLVLSLQCACSGSTSGGVKADRSYVAFKTIQRHIRMLLHPSSVSQIKVGRSYISDSEALPVMLYIVLYCLIIIVSVGILLAIGVDGEAAVSGAIASMGNVGPGIGELGTAGTYATQPAAAKTLYTLCMILGRLEIYPVAAVIYMLFGRKE